MSEQSVAAGVDRMVQEAKERAAALKERKESAPSPPSYPSLCLEQTLYSPVQIDPARHGGWLEKLRWKSMQFDAYCVRCGQQTTFRTMTDRADDETAEAQKYADRNSTTLLRYQRLIFEDGQFGLHLACSRNQNHLYSYFFQYDANQAILTKIGQFPSLEDIAGADIERYRKILGSDFSELRKATGLFAHGIGIGAFIYLRRIFERLVDDARASAGFELSDFHQLSMSERVQALEAQLPEAVVRFKSAWGILSKGVHELSEDECKRLFPVVRTAIIMMLEQRYEAEQKRKVADDLEREFRSIEASLSAKAP